MPKTLRLLLPALFTGLAVLVLISAGCAANREADTPTPDLFAIVAATETAVAITGHRDNPFEGICLDPGEGLIGRIHESMTTTWAGIRAPYIVRSEIHPELWYLAAEVDGRGWEGIKQMAVWAMISEDGSPASGDLYTLNSVASLITGFETAPDKYTPTYHDPVDTYASSCARIDLEKDPNIPVLPR